jgi:hypothetical protein
MDLIQSKIERCKGKKKAMDEEEKETLLFD